jgi:hypothetical protein
MNKSRRGFLCKLGAVAVSTAFPLPASIVSPSLEGWVRATQDVRTGESMIFYGTVTGRWTSDMPNMQSLTRSTEAGQKIRRAFTDGVASVEWGPSKDT